MHLSLEEFDTKDVEQNKHKVRVAARRVGGDTDLSLDCCQVTLHSAETSLQSHDTSKIITKFICWFYELSFLMDPSLQKKKCDCNYWFEEYGNKHTYIYLSSVYIFVFSSHKGQSDKWPRSEWYKRRLTIVSLHSILKFWKPWATVISSRFWSTISLRLFHLKAWNSIEISFRIALTTMTFDLIIFFSAEVRKTLPLYISSVTT